ncbi:MAG: CPBP family intramembrane metalloprotease [Polyangiaceae bacterium]|nr:CPBP family intramembrane metalloprotease [Polyangiaceae bacterium]
MSVSNRRRPEEGIVRGGSGPWADLGLTLPLFLGYHLGVVFLPVRNAADWVTRELVSLADQSLLAYGGLTMAIGTLFVSVLMLLGRGHALRWERFALVAVEGVLYAIVLRLAASYVVGRLTLVPGGAPVLADAPGALVGVVMALGAGFYEEIAFRVVLFGIGTKLALWALPSVTPVGRLLKTVIWAALAAAAFSGWHYFGELGDAFDLRSFVFRWVAGLVFSAIYALRGFAPAVWTHTLYDLWVLVL